MLAAATDWSALEVGGAFILGAFFGSIGVIRVLDYLRRREPPNR